MIIQNIWPHCEKAHCFRASLWRPFQAVSYDAKKKETSFLIPKQKRKKWQATIHYYFFSCSVRKKADIVVFVRDIFLHDLQFSHSLGSVKHSHFISKAKDVLTIKHFSLDCSVLPNINISIAKKGKKWRDHKLLIFWIETEI